MKSVKKAFSAFGSLLVIIAILFTSCKKENNTDANGSSSIAGSVNIDGTAHTVLTGTSVIGSTYVLVSNTKTVNYPSISIYFAGTSAPAAGSYTANANYPAAGNSNVSITPSISITWTVLTCSMTVTSGSSKSVSFSGATFTDGTSTHTVSANLPF